MGDQVIRMLLHGLALPGQFIRLPPVVGIEKGDQFPLRSTDTGIACCRSTPVFLPQQSDLYGGFAGQLINQRGSPVGGAVIDHQQFPAGVVLRKHRPDRSYQQRGPVPCWNYNRNQ